MSKLFGWTLLGKPIIFGYVFSTRGIRHRLVWHRHAIGDAAEILCAYRHPPRIPNSCCGECYGIVKNWKWK